MVKTRAPFTRSPTLKVAPLIVARRRAGAINVDVNNQRGADFMPVLFPGIEWLGGRVGSINPSAWTLVCQTIVR